MIGVGCTCGIGFGRGIDVGEVVAICSPVVARRWAGLKPAPTGLTKLLMCASCAIHFVTAILNRAFRRSCKGRDASGRDHRASLPQRLPRPQFPAQRNIVRELTGLADPRQKRTHCRIQGAQRNAPRASLRAGCGHRHAVGQMGFQRFSFSPFFWRAKRKGVARGANTRLTPPTAN